MATVRRTSRPAALALAAGLAVALAIAGEAVKTHHHDLLVGSVVFALPAALWAAQRVEPAWPLSIGLGLSVFSGNWGYMGLHVPFDRVLIGFGLLAVAVHAGRSENRSLLRVEPVHWLLLGATVVALISAIWVGSIGDKNGQFQLLDRYGVFPFLAFFAAPLAFRTERQRGILIGTLVATGAYLGFTALCEGIHLDGLVVPRYILDPTVGIHADRARGPFVEAVANGMGLYYCLIASLIAARRWATPVARVAALVVAVGCAAGIVFTLTRAVWLAAVIASLVALLATRGLRRYTIPAVLAGLVTVGIALAAVPGLTGSATQRADSQLPVWDRLNSDAAALRMIADRPVLGFGWSRFTTDSLPYFHEAANYPLTGSTIEVHNVFLSNAVELGLLGASVWLAGLLLGVVRPIFNRRGPPELEPWRVSLLAIFVFWFVVANFGPVAYAFPTFLMWLWAGIVHSGRRRPAEVPETVRPVGQPLLAPPRAILRRA